MPTPKLDLVRAQHAAPLREVIAPRRKELEALTDNFIESLSPLVNYGVYRRYLRKRKARHDKLLAHTEEIALTHTEIALKALDRCIDLAHRMGAVLGNKGTQLVESCIPQAGHEWRTEARIKLAVDEIRDMGAPSDAIACIETRFRKADYNMLRIGGTNSTFSGLVASLERSRSVLKDDFTSMRAHGLPVITGADNDDDHVEEPVAIAVAVLAIILTLLLL